ncbi:MAG TPA: transcriptional regulator GcvA [Caulobacteraceae bacterium]|jgi:LysR family glycine cleavage system transcriptional activator
MQRLPPFTALRALEAAARLQSYTRAAEELHVTHGAISQQIRALEEDLGTRLFRRDGNAMLPSEEALRLGRRVADATRLMESVVAEIRAAHGPASLTISTVSSFATRWLAPRVGSFSARFPDVLINVRTEDRLADFQTDGIDVAIRYGRGAWPGVHAEPLFKETLFPVCSPEFLARYPIAAPADLLHVPLLRHSFWPWRLWFRSLGLEYEEPATGMTFDDSGVLAEAAANGLGVALGRSTLIQPELVSGRLVRPIPMEIGAEFSHFLVWRPDSRKLPLIERFKDWILEEAAASAA